MFAQHTMTRRAFLGASASAVGALAVAPGLAAESKKKLVMLAGKPSHGPMEHEFNAGVLLMAKCLAGAPGLEVVHYKGGWPDSEKAFEGASGIPATPTAATDTRSSRPTTCPSSPTS